MFHSYRKVKKGENLTNKSTVAARADSRERRNVLISLHNQSPIMFGYAFFSLVPTPLTVTLAIERCLRYGQYYQRRRNIMAEIGLYEAMRTLRAVRRLRPDPIPDDVLRRVLEAATWAPTGGNRQAWRVIVVKDPVRNQRLDEARTDWGDQRPWPLR